MFGQRLLAIMCLEPQAASEWGHATDFLSFVWGVSAQIHDIFVKVMLHYSEDTNEILDGNMIDIQRFGSEPRSHPLAGVIT